MASSTIPQDYQIVPVKVNLGATFRQSRRPRDSISYILPLPFQQYIGTPSYEIQASSPKNGIYHSTSLGSSREATPSASDSPLYRASPPQSVNNVDIATQQVAISAGPTRGSGRGQRRNKGPTPYTRPTATTATFSDPITLGSGHPLSALAMDRLSVQGICKLQNCRQTFTSGEAYRCHIQDSHHIMPAKHGKETFQCPWEGCGRSQTKASLSNHILGHSMKAGCGLCDEVIPPRSDLVKKHYKLHHGETRQINSKNLADYAYLHFQGEGALINGLPIVDGNEC